MNALPVPQTVEVKRIGPYHGPRISGASDDMDEVRLSRSYEFETFSIIISGIPAKRDNRTGRLYVSAWVAKRVQDKVAEVSAAIEGLPADASAVLPVIHPKFSVDAADFLTDAA
jgi:hypothetical protein